MRRPRSLPLAGRASWPADTVHQEPRTACFTVVTLCIYTGSLVV